MNGARWILVADSTQARTYVLAKGELLLKDTLEHPPSGEHNRDLVGNRPDQNQHPMEKALKGDEAQSLRDDESLVFAREVSRKLSHAHATNAFGELMIVADPRFLGLLRANLSRPVANAVIATVDKHALQMSTEQLTQLVTERVG